MKEKTNKKTIKNNKVLLLFLSLIIIGIIAFIFIMSSQNGYQSQGVSRSIIRFIKDNIPMAEALQSSPIFMQANFNILLRKLVHFTEFSLLAGIIYAFLVKIEFKKWKISKTVLIVSLFFAVLDEFHQFFVRGRTALFTDVIVDFAGAAFAVFIIHIIKRAKGKVQSIPPL